MRIVVLFNPISGRGLAAAQAQIVTQRLNAAGHQVSCAPTRTDPLPTWLDPLLAGVDLLVIVGGDGAVRLGSAAAARCGVPIYHFPAGTENLFAREFGMRPDPEQLVAAIERSVMRAIDVGYASGRLFLLMVSIGFDAEVVHDLANCRGRTISHWSYLRPIARQFMRWRPAPLRVSVDAQPINPGEPGFVVIANARQYGWRLNPAGRASMSDGVLDVAWFPARGRCDLALWALRARLQRHLSHPRLVYRTGRCVRVESDSLQRFQVDGDPPEIVGPTAGEPHAAAGEPWALDVTIKPGALKVLVP